MTSPRKICLVSTDILGLITNSGIATATTHLALTLAHQGYDVTVLNTGSAKKLDDTWKGRYRDAGVMIEHSDDATTVSPEYLHETYLAYRHLKDRDFETIVFQDWGGMAFASVKAKQAGIAFDSTRLVIVTHGPTGWVRESNLELKLDDDGLALGYMEQAAIEGADAVVGPSDYLIRWMLSAGWKLPERRAIIPYFTAGYVADLTGMTDLRTPRGERSSARLSELVFFGRLERRKGVLIYTAALNLVDPRLLEGVVLSFLGREATYTKSEVMQMLSTETRAAAGGVRFFTALDQEQARAYLHEPGRAAVIPSLDDNSPNTVYECLEDGIPFIASDAGGIGELVDPRDREACLFMPEPEAIAASVTRLLKADTELPARRPAFDGSASLAAWESLLSAEVSRTARVVSEPLVSVVVPHHERPDLVCLTLESLERQDYQNMEIVLVDDGSTTAEAHAALRRFEEQDWRHPLQVVRQENRFLGAARNSGVRHARGDLIVFIDDDDLAEPDYVSTMVKAIDHTGADAVTCAFVTFEDEEGASSKPPGAWVFLGGFLALAAVQNCLGGAGMILRRQAWEAVGGFHEEHGLGLEDYDLLVRITMAGFTVFAHPEPLYRYRLRPDSMRLTMNRYQSHQIVLNRFRELLPPEFGPLIDLVHGQARIALENPDKERLEKELDQRERHQWLLERRIEMLLGQQAGLPEERLSH